MWRLNDDNGDRRGAIERYHLQLCVAMFPLESGKLLCEHNVKLIIFDLR